MEKTKKTLRDVESDQRSDKKSLASAQRHISVSLKGVASETMHLHVLVYSHRIIARREVLNLIHEALRARTSSDDTVASLDREIRATAPLCPVELECSEPGINVRTYGNLRREDFAEIKTPSVDGPSASLDDLRAVMQPDGDPRSVDVFETTVKSVDTCPV